MARRREWLSWEGFFESRCSAMRLPLLLSIVSVWQALSGCGSPCAVGQSVAFPSSDSTPPVRTVMDVHFPNQPIQSVSSSSPDVSVQIVGNPVLAFIASSEDPEGVGDIQIWVEETWWRTHPDGTETQVGPGLLGRPEASNPSTSRSEACTQRMATLNLDVNARRRGANRYRVRAWAVGVNTAGARRKTSDITLSWP